MPILVTEQEIAKKSSSKYNAHPKNFLLTSRLGDFGLGATAALKTSAKEDCSAPFNEH